MLIVGLLPIRLKSHGLREDYLNGSEIIVFIRLICQAIKTNLENGKMEMIKIKFRGQQKFKGCVSTIGKWEYGYYRKFQNKHYINNIEVIYETVGQYFGVNDKNDKEIYHNDVVRFPSGNMYVVSFPEDFLWVETQQKEIEVVGNIIDNPELKTKTVGG